MKLKYLFPLLFAMLALMTSCDEDEKATMLDEIKVSSSYVAIPVEGGATKITVTSQDSWTAEKVTTDKNKVEWLTISSTTGSAGESELTFTAPSAIDGRTAEVLIKSGGVTQRINIIQGLAQISEATVAEAKAAPDGKTLRLTGIVTKIESAYYGNWFLTDETGELYIRGTVNDKNEFNFETLGIEVGDEVTIEGPKSTYSGKAQLNNVMVIELNKSLIQIDSLVNDSLPIEGGIFSAMLTVKGEGVSIDIPEDAKSWLGIAAVESAGDSAVVKFQAAPNAGGDRGTTIKFRTVKDGKTYSTETSIFQKGAIVKATVAEFIAAEVSGTQYRLAGVITEIKNADYGNVNIKDFSGEAYVHGIKDFKTKGLKVGDIITIVGKRAEYNGAQVAGAVLESVIPVTAATIAELLTKPDSKDDYYMVTGEIKEVKDAFHGNVDLKDGDNEIHMRGFYPGYGAYNDEGVHDYRKNFIVDKGLKVGDEITVITTKGSFGGVAQLNNGIYFSHESAE